MVMGLGSSLEPMALVHKTISAPDSGAGVGPFKILLRLDVYPPTPARTAPPYLGMIVSRKCPLSCASMAGVGDWEPESWFPEWLLGQCRF